MAEKLDGVMLVLFQYIDNKIAKGRDEEHVLFDILLGIFEESILMTHGSKYVQFALFYLTGRASASAELSTRFVERLLEIAFDSERPRVVRQSSIAYIASFLARSSFVDHSLLLLAMTRLLEWIKAYMDYVEALCSTSTSTAASASSEGMRGRQPSEHESDVVLAPQSQLPKTVMASPHQASASLLSQSEHGSSHTFFYACCQSAFYVLCFHGMTLLCQGNEQTAVWERLLRSPLNPLKNCLDTVRREFARLCCVVMASDLPPDLLQMVQRISRENGTSQPKGIAVGHAVGATSGMSTSRAGGLGKGTSNPLDSFFPFDPYLLRRSHMHVASIYNHWKGVMEVRDADAEEKSENDDSQGSSDSGDTDDEEEDETENDDGEEMSISIKIASSLISDMSCTPVSVSPGPLRSRAWNIANRRAPGSGVATSTAAGSRENDAFNEVMSANSSPGTVSGIDSEMIGKGVAGLRKESVEDELW
ncbi:unnamed protein product [Chrysoparadoxa australica]